jgi:hypothetical protein
MFTRTLFALILLAQASLAGAQDLRLDALADGTLVFGVVSTADGAPAADTAVQFALASQPQTQVAAVQTDVVGIFSWTGAPQTDYQVRAGNTTASVTTGEAPPQPFQWPPIYITLGALLLLSLIPARLLRRPELR